MKRKLQIWIARMLEGNPFGGDDAERSVQIAEYLAEQGHQVTYFGTAFNHVTKEQDFPKTVFRRVRDNERAVMLHVPTTYKKNVSVNRYLYTIEQASLLRRIISNWKFEKPDLIFAATPTVETCAVLEKYGKKEQVPVVVDMRDEWPDVFLSAFPQKLQPLAKMALVPLRRQAGNMFRSADAIFAMSPSALQFGLDYAGREATDLDAVIYIGREKYVPETETRKRILQELGEKGVTKETWNACLFTSLSKVSLDMDTVLDSARKIHELHPEFRILIGGRGDDEARLREKAGDMDYVFFLGYLDEDYMSTVMSISKIGLMPYANRTMENAWGNKVGQYFSYSLPILTSTNGVAKEYFEQYDCGLHYEEGKIDSFTKVVLSLMNSPIQLENLSKNAEDRYLADFEYANSMKQIEKSLLQVYEHYRG
ncbi:MAG: glycosyltransferase [Lachnospiraceae bacterium]|nr:glycosyltransferase [Lachnospiraceae bacterium]